MRVYLDNCCYNRPFDEQGQLRVCIETGDYTRWRQNNLFAGESLDEVLDRAEQADLRRAERLKSAPVI